MLRPLQEIFHAGTYPDLLVGLDIADDAAVYRIGANRVLIHTVDFFTPVVDDPYDYGAVSAANALSDVYAMGGEVVLALNICGFPSCLPSDTITEILRGGAEKVREAGAALAGGHTIQTGEPLYGLSVIGMADENAVLTKGGGKPGDRLVLTKPLGTGIITTAAKADQADAAHVGAAVSSMARLNRDAARILRRHGCRACTDVTGFSLLGHGSEMAHKGGIRLSISLSAIPVLDGAKRYAGEWLFPGGTARNESAYGAGVGFDGGISGPLRRLLFTPETSGGLLAAVPPETAVAAVGELAACGHACADIGCVAAGAGIEVRQ